MDVKVSYGQCTSAPEAFEAAKGVLTKEYISQFKIKADVQVDEDNLVIKAKGKGFELAIVFKENHCEASLTLGLLYKAFRGKVLATIEKRLTKVV